MTFLYIDPGTGSMLFSIAIGVVATLVFSLRALVVKIRFVLSGGRAEKISANKIPYVIFTDHKRYWNIFKPICDEFERRKIPLVYYTQSEDDPVLSEKYEFVKAEFIGEGNKGFVKMNMLNACIVLATTPGLDVLQWKRSRTVDYYVHISHGIDTQLRYRMYGLAFFDAVLLNGNHQIDDIRLCEVAQNTSKKELVITGAPFFDTLLERKKSLTPPLRIYSSHIERAIVLLSPTWGKVGLLSLYGTKIIDALLDTGFQIVIRPHPQSITSESDMLKNLTEHYKDNPLIEWNYDNDNAAILNRADIMVSDVSGVIFDFAFIFDKPFLYLNAEYDNSVYDSSWVDTVEWGFKVMPELGREIKPEDFGNLKQIIADTLTSKDIEEKRRQIRDDAWHFQGKGGEKTVDYLVAKYNELQDKKGSDE